MMTSPVIVGLLFALRCLIPPGILFGVSYLLRRWELVVENSDEALLADMKEDAAMKPAGGDVAKKSPPQTKKKSSGKKKPIVSKNKEGRR